MNHEKKLLINKMTLSIKLRSYTTNPRAADLVMLSYMKMKFIFNILKFKYIYFINLCVIGLKNSIFNVISLNLNKPQNIFKSNIDLVRVKIQY